jgi:hypothetical protein
MLNQHELIADLEAFLRYQMPVIELGRSTSREAVCLVFEKVNTGGKKLDAFELLTAIFAADEFDLRQDWLGTGKEPGRHKRLARHNVLCQLGPTEFLQSISLLYTAARRRLHIAEAKGGEAPPVICTRDALLALPLSEYKKFAPQAEAGFERVARFLRAQKIYWFKDLPYHTQLIPLAAILAIIGDRWMEDAARRKLARWFWCGVFGELYGSAVETRFAKDVWEVPAWIDGGDEPSSVKEAAFRADRLDTMTSRLSAAYKGVHALLMREGARDFRSGQSFDDSVYFDEAVDIHHVFPRVWCEKSGIPRSRYDTIVMHSGDGASGDSPMLVLSASLMTFARSDFLEALSTCLRFRSDFSSPLSSVTSWTRRATSSPQVSAIISRGTS